MTHATESCGYTTKGPEFEECSRSVANNLPKDAKCGDNSITYYDQYAGTMVNLPDWLPESPMTVFHMVSVQGIEPRLHEDNLRTTK